MHRQQRQAREGLGLRALRRAVWNDEDGTGEAPQAPASDRHAPGSRAARANAAWQELGRTAARDGWAKRFVLDVAHGRLSLPAGSAVSALSQLAVLDPDAVRDLLKQAHPVCAPVVAAALGQACGRFHGELVGAAQEGGGEIAPGGCRGFCRGSIPRIRRCRGGAGHTRWRSRWRSTFRRYRGPRARTRRVGRAALAGPVETDHQARGPACSGERGLGSGHAVAGFSPGSARSAQTDSFERDGWQERGGCRAP